MCPSHIWGSDFDFEGLGYTAHWLSRYYHAQTGKYIIWKEKYGTIRYEMHCSWMTTKEEQQEFAECLKSVIKQFPQFAGELCDDYFEPYGNIHVTSEYDSFFAGVVFLHDALNKDDTDECPF